MTEETSTNPTYADSDSDNEDQGEPKDEVFEKIVGQIHAFCDKLREGIERNDDDLLLHVQQFFHPSFFNYLNDNNDNDTGEEEEEESTLPPIRDMVEDDRYFVHELLRTIKHSPNAKVTSVHCGRPSKRQLKRRQKNNKTAEDNSINNLIEYDIQLSARGSKRMHNLVTGIFEFDRDGGGVITKAQMERRLYEEMPDGEFQQRPRKIHRLRLSPYHREPRQQINILKAAATAPTILPPPPTSSPAATTTSTSPSESSNTVATSTASSDENKPNHAENETKANGAKKKEEGTKQQQQPQQQGQVLALTTQDGRPFKNGAYFQRCPPSSLTNPHNNNNNNKKNNKAQVDAPTIPERFLSNVKVIPTMSMFGGNSNKNKKTASGANQQRRRLRSSLPPQLILFDNKNEPIALCRSGAGKKHHNNNNNDAESDDHDDDGDATNHDVVMIYSPRPVTVAANPQNLVPAFRERITPAVPPAAAKKATANASPSPPPPPVVSSSLVSFYPWFKIKATSTFLGQRYVVKVLTTDDNGDHVEYLPMYKVVVLDEVHQQQQQKRSTSDDEDKDEESSATTTTTTTCGNLYDYYTGDQLGTIMLLDDGNDNNRAKKKQNNKKNKKPTNRGDVVDRGTTDTEEEADAKVVSVEVDIVKTLEPVIALCVAASIKEILMS